MSPKKKIVLYNPEAVFFDMPLALLSIGSQLSSSEYEVIIVDGRIEPDVPGTLAIHLPDALCFGITVITGAPIKDALKVTEKAKAINGAIPVIWGGWHTSLFPTEILEENPLVDITVQGQGEATFAELVKCLTSNEDLSAVKGIAYRKEGEIVKNAPRAMVDMDSFQRINYDLIDVEAYFRKKGKRQFDYISSVGCFFRCSFCADPFVFQRKFSAVSPEKMGAELAYYHDKYQFEDLNFQDETFFTYANRIEAFANEIITRKLKFTWAATMRADQGERLPDEVWRKCKESGLRRLLIGVESGSQEMMDWMKKDVKLTQVFYCAEKCKELGIGVIFPFIIGFPGESDKSVDESVKVIKRLRGMSSRFNTPIFYFKPYPGSTITQSVTEQGYELPTTTEEWGDFDYIGSSGPWVSPEKEKFFEAFKFYLAHGFTPRRNLFHYPIRKISQWRCKHNAFRFPIEKMIIERLLPVKKLS